jgi:hypothetical protein
MNSALAHKERAHTNADAPAKAAHITGDEDRAKSSRRRRRRSRWKLPITDGPFAESKEMMGGLSVPQRLLTTDGIALVSSGRRP